MRLAFAEQLEGRSFFEEPDKVAFYTRSPHAHTASLIPTAGTPFVSYGELEADFLQRSVAMEMRTKFLSGVSWQENHQLMTIASTPQAVI